MAAHNHNPNPAVSAEQYRLAQAVLSGTARESSMPVSVAREIVERTPARLRSEYSRYTENPGDPLDRFNDLQKQGFMKRPKKKSVTMYRAMTPHGATYTGPKKEIAEDHVRKYGGHVEAFKGTQNPDGVEVELTKHHHFLPFSTKKAAETMKRLLQAEGVKAAVKKVGGEWGVDHTHANPFYGTDLDLETTMAPAWMYYGSKQERDIAARMYEGRGKQVVLGHSMFGFKEGGGKKWRLRGLDHRGNPALAASYPTLVKPDGTVVRVKNLGWILRNWKNASNFTWETSGSGGVFRADMRDGSVYSTPYADFSVFRRFIDRPVFRGLTIRVDGKRYEVGSPEWKELRASHERNPRPAADDMYASFHGEPSDETIEIAGEEHYHSHLAALGELVELKVKLVNGGTAVIGFETGASEDEVDNPFWSSARSTASKISGSVLAGLKRAAASKKERARWIPYATTDSEVRAQAKAGYLEAHDVSAKVERRKVGGVFSRKYKFDVVVDREQLRDMFKKSAAEKKVSRGTRPGGSKPSGAYKGYQIREIEDGFAVPKLDPSGKFASKKDAKEFIDYTLMGAKVKNPGPFREAGKLLGRGTRVARKPMNDFIGAAGKVGGYLDDELGRVLNPETERKFTTKSGADNFAAYMSRPGTHIKNVSVRKIHEAGDKVHYIVSWELIPFKRNPGTRDTGPAYLTANEDGTALMIVGGDQSLDLPGLGITGDMASKESIVIGKITNIVYHTRKTFDGKPEEFDYTHKMGEETGDLPTLRYDRINERLYIDGGAYKIDRPLTGTSPGLEN